MKGTIKQCIRGQGFGFIATEDGKEIYFHRSVLEGIKYDSLEEGMSVEFDIEQSPRGLSAVNVKKV